MDALAAMDVDDELCCGYVLLPVELQEQEQDQEQQQQQLSAGDELRLEVHSGSGGLQVKLLRLGWVGRPRCVVALRTGARARLIAALRSQSRRGNAAQRALSGPAARAQERRRKWGAAGAAAQRPAAVQGSDRGGRPAGEPSSWSRGARGCSVAQTPLALPPSIPPH